MKPATERSCRTERSVAAGTAKLAGGVKGASAALEQCATHELHGEASCECAGESRS